MQVNEDVWFLDDIPERVELLTELTGVRPVHELNVRSALRTKSYRNRRFWFLDHDMCARPGLDDRCPMSGTMICRCLTGKQFLTRIVQQGEPWPEAVIVHSANVVARSEMITLLRQAGCPRYYLLPVERWRAEEITLRSLLLW